jgi:hypothetical protein
MELVRGQHEYDVDIWVLDDFEGLDCLVGNVELPGAVVDCLLGDVADGNNCKSDNISNCSLGIWEAYRWFRSARVGR